MVEHLSVFSPTFLIIFSISPITLKKPFKGIKTRFHFLILNSMFLDAVQMQKNAHSYIRFRIRSLFTYIVPVEIEQQGTDQNVNIKCAIKNTWWHAPKLFRTVINMKRKKQAAGGNKEGILLRSKLILYLGKSSSLVRTINWSGRSSFHLQQMNAIYSQRIFLTQLTHSSPIFVPIKIHSPASYVWPDQCDQMDRSFLNIWPFITAIICRA